ncbi:MAG: hypothetical protein ACOCRK_01585 [bacterium]
MTAFKARIYKTITIALKGVKTLYIGLCKRLRWIRNIIYHLYHRLRIKVINNYKELLLIVAFLTGWILITSGISDLIGNWFSYLSYGFLLLGLCGFRLIKKISLDGIYILSED